MISPTGRPPRRPGVICGGRSRPGCRWTIRVLTRRRWCIGASGWPSPGGRIGSTTRCGRLPEETGVVRGRRKRAVDSTILADAVATQDTITQLVAAIRRVGRIVPGAAARSAAVCTGHDYSRLGKPDIDWDDPAAKDALVSALVNDATALLATLTDTH